MTTPPSPPPQMTYAAPRQKPRPSALWFLGPVALVVLATAVFGVGLFTTLRSVMHVDGVFAADGAPHAVVLSKDGKQMLLSTDLGGTCDVTDSTGQAVPVSQEASTFTRSDGNGTFTKVGVFTASGVVSISCAATDQAVRMEVGPAVDPSGFVGRILVTILVPLLLGGAGVIWLIVLAIVFFTRPARTSAPVNRPASP